MDSEFLKIKPLAQRLGVSQSTIKSWRRRGWLMEGIHFARISYNLLTYNLDLVQHWLATRSQPELHDRKIQEYLAGLEPETAKSKRKAA